MRRPATPAVIASFALLLPLAALGGRLAPAPAPATAIKVSDVRTYAPGRHFVITLDLGAPPASTDPADYSAVLAYLGDDGTATGKQTTDNWACSSVHTNPKFPNLVTIRFKAKRSLPIKQLVIIKLTAGTGTLTITVPPPTATTTPTVDVPVDDVGADPC
jgi:hypothetical protein